MERKHETRGIKLNEGKTKIIWEVLDDDGTVDIESKSDITAGDGEKRDYLEGKAEIATTTTINCFRLLEEEGIPTHFIEQMDNTTFRAHKVQMIPIELVARRVAFGSYLKRNPNTAEGLRFDDPVIEFFDKDDAKHDPLLDLDSDSGIIKRYDPKKPVCADSLLDELPMEDYSPELWAELSSVTRRVFEVLESAWSDQDVMLVDMKIECGITKDGRLVVADVIDNDSWRIWPKGDVKQMKDKQVYRDGSASLEDITKNYKWVADATERF